MSEKGKWAVAGISVAVFLAIGVLGVFRLGDSPVYYTRIDNSKIKENHTRGGVIDLTGGMAYIYTLSAYDGQGRGETISFGADRELRQGTFLCLKTAPIRGVISWAEVQFDALPQAVRAVYQGR